MENNKQDILKENGDEIYEMFLIIHKGCLKTYKNSGGRSLRITKKILLDIIRDAYAEGYIKCREKT